MKQLNPCIVPGCEKNKIPTDKDGLCIEHRKLLNFLLFALPRIRFNKPPQSKIVVPGTKQYEQAVFDIVKKAQDGK